MLPASLSVAEVVSALSQALDLGSGSTPWHSVRTCLLGMRIAAELRLCERTQHELFYVLLLKDAGCSGNVGLAFAGAACGSERGAALARLMKLPEGTAAGIAALNEHWNGRGYPRRLKGEQIPIASRIALLAQMLDVLFTSAGPKAPIATVSRNSGVWFDPDVFKAAQSISRRGKLWVDLTNVNLTRLALRLEPLPTISVAGHVSLETICRAFAMIVDAKSAFTYNHSNGVANVAVQSQRSWSWTILGSSLSGTPPASRPWQDGRSERDSAKTRRAERRGMAIDSFPSRTHAEDS